MTTYAIGDIQGCYQTFLTLLNCLQFNSSKDRLWFVGDIINRGTGSLDMLRWCYQNREKIQIVLGNHDLHTIAVAHKVKQPHRSDTISTVLHADDCETLLTWLRMQPLIIHEMGYTMVHAGILPSWNLEQAIGYAQEVEAYLQGNDYIAFLNVMYGNTPVYWNEKIDGLERLRFITNVFTRMRVCDSRNGLEFEFKGELSQVPDGYTPWFSMLNRKTIQNPIIFGHWSALGLRQQNNVFALDTGCLWGRKLTAMSLETKEIFQVDVDSRDLPLKSH
jgi:bis(5'-nucleosyl)-tetraphosphatase (symmetrical)